VAESFTNTLLTNKIY
jgi:hypothetical protein